MRVYICSLSCDWVASNNHFPGIFISTGRGTSAHASSMVVNLTATLLSLAMAFLVGVDCCGWLAGAVLSATKYWALSIAKEPMFPVAEYPAMLIAGDWSKYADVNARSSGE